MGEVPVPMQRAGRERVKPIEPEGSGVIAWIATALLVAVLAVFFASWRHVEGVRSRAADARGRARVQAEVDSVAARGGGLVESVRVFEVGGDGGK